MLEGKLIRLRSIEEEDLDYYYSWANDAELARLVLGMATPYSRGQLIKLWDSYSQSPDHDLLLTLETLSEKAPIGFCFLRNIHPIHRFAELEQFFIGEEKYRHNGFGRDAIETLLTYCFTELNLGRLWLITYAYNLVGIQFYKQCGFLKEGVLREVQFTRGRFHDGIMMAILKKDWLSQNPD